MKINSATVECTTCGSSYDPTNRYDVRNHNRYHRVLARGLRTCLTCDCTYLQTDAEDRAAHRRHHWEMKAAQKRLGIRLVGQRLREKFRERARRAAFEEASLDARVVAAERYIMWLFIRSLVRAVREGYWRKHCSLSEFIAMFDCDGLFARDVADALYERHGWLPKLLEGGAYWSPALSFLAGVVIPESLWGRG